MILYTISCNSIAGMGYMNGFKSLLQISALSAIGWAAPLDGVPQRAPEAATIDIAILVFREGLECILVLAAVTASMRGPREAQKRPVAFGAGVAVLASIATWFLAIRIINDLMESIPALQIQAATGLLAIVVLLVVMNWFFHNVYWTGWISMHNRRKQQILNEEREAGSRVLTPRMLWGLGLLGFTSLYREGFEIVLFLQSYRLKQGNSAVFDGAFAGLVLTSTVAVLTFIAHRRLPYKRMLVLTGIMLGGVLLVMVGEQVQEMQMARWLPTTEIPIFAHLIPDWVGMWFAIFPNVQGLVGQGIAGTLVIGSYYLSEQQVKAKLGAPVPVRQCIPEA